MNKGKFRCSQCDRTFAMPAHLARHVSTIHRAPGSPAPVGRKPVNGRRRGRKGRKMGRPAGVVSRFGIRDLSLDQLSSLIDAARSEARRKIAELQTSFL